MKEGKKAIPKGTRRRDFLKLAALSTPIAVVGVAKTDDAEAAAPNLESERIQDTAHTRAYYESARF